MQIRAPAGPAGPNPQLGLDADPTSPAKDVEVSGLEGRLPPGQPPPVTPTSPAEEARGVDAPKTRDPKLAREARDRHLAEPQAAQWQHNLQGQLADPQGAEPVGEAERAGRSRGQRSQDPNQQKDLADKIRGTIDELRAEARGLRAGAADLLTGAPSGEDAMDSRSLSAKAAANDAEANALEPKLREEEMKRRVVSLEPLVPQRGAAPAGAPAHA